MPTTAGTAYLMASPPWATTATRAEPREDLAESEGEAGFEPLGGTIAALVVEGHVDRHFGRSVEEGEQPVARRSGFIEAVDQQAGRTLGAAAAR